MDLDNSTKLQAVRRRMRLLRNRLASLPRAQLGIFPTPVHRLSALGREAGSRALYIKRDDMAGLALGGNKVRSLEYLLGEARAQGADTVICGGGIQSNMCRLAAASAALLGMRCILVHNDHEPSVVEGNHLLYRLFGANSVYAGPIPETARDQLCRDVATAEAAKGRRPFIVEHGGSTPLGSMGYARAALELLEQDFAAGIGLRHIVIVGAMGGTAAGLIAGIQILGGPYRVHVISVEYAYDELHRRLSQLSGGALGLLGFSDQARLAAKGQRPVPAQDFVSVYDDYLGPGYAVPTPAGRRALQDAARLEAILLEPIYTAKTLAGCLDLIRRGVIPPDEPCCVWHTGGTGALFAMASEVLAAPC